MTTSKHKITYRVGDSDVEEDTILISLTGTGVNAVEHKDFLNKAVQKLGIELCAHANNIDLWEQKAKITKQKP